MKNMHKSTLENRVHFCATFFLKILDFYNKKMYNKYEIKQRSKDFGKEEIMKTTEIRITMTHDWTSPFKIMWVKRENNIPDSAEVKATYDNTHNITTLIFKWGDLE